MHYKTLKVHFILDKGLLVEMTGRMVLDGLVGRTIVHCRIGRLRSAHSDWFVERKGYFFEQKFQF